MQCLRLNFRGNSHSQMLAEIYVTEVSITLFVLSIDFWNWNSDTRVSDWIPVWIIYLVKSLQDLER